jgi:hypothetical protein
MNGSARDWLLRLLHTLLDFSAENQGVRALSMEFMAQGMRHPESARGSRRCTSAWRDLFAATLRASPEHREGRMRGTPEAVAYAIVAMVDGFIVQIGLEREPGSKEALMARVEPLIDAWFRERA